MNRYSGLLKSGPIKPNTTSGAAVYLLGLGVVAPTDIICFHAQQCVEKYLKSILVLHQIPVPKTHDIEKVLNSFPKETSFR